MGSEGVHPSRLNRAGERTLYALEGVYKRVPTGTAGCWPRERVEF